MAKKTDILRAIEETYRRWERIHEALRKDGVYEARRILKTTHCSICNLAGGHCERCPVVIEYGRLPGGHTACSELNVTYISRAMYALNCYYSTDRFIVVTQRLLRCIDNLRERVRNSDAYDEGDHNENVKID